MHTRAHSSQDDLAQLELCYAPPYGGAKDPVNFAGPSESYGGSESILSFSPVRARASCRAEDGRHIYACSMQS